MSDDLNSLNPIDQLLAGFIPLVPDVPADVSEQQAPPASDGFHLGKENSKSDDQVDEIENLEVMFDPSFSYEGYQIVRGEYFAHINEPSITFNDYTISVNIACIRKAPQVEYVQLLIHPEQRKFVIRPCVEDEKDSFLWCSAKRKPKQITCRMFFAKVVHIMGWNPNYRYKLIGKMIRSQDEYLFAFDMKATEIYQRLMRNDESGKEKRTTIRRPVYHVLDRVLYLCISTWEGDQLSFTANMLRGIAKLIDTFGDTIRSDEFVERLGRVSIKEIARVAKERRNGSLGFAETILMYYNKRTKYSLRWGKLYDTMSENEHGETEENPTPENIADDFDSVGENPDEIENQ